MLVIEYPHKTLQQVKNLLARFVRGHARAERRSATADCRSWRHADRQSRRPRHACSRVYETLVGGRFLIVEVQDRFSLAGEPRKTQRVSVVVYDHLGADDGDLIAFTESREACMPFYPEKRVPLDAYNAAILDRVVVSHEI